MSNLFVLISGLFVSTLLLSNIIAGQLILIDQWVLPGAVILFPIAYILGDVITEVYGYDKNRVVIWTGFIANILMVAVFAVLLKLPTPEFFQAADAYYTVLYMTPRIVGASLIAYLLGSFCNSYILSKLKILTAGRYLWVRTIGSTIVGEALDTILFISIAFYGIQPLAIIGQMILAQYVFKLGYEILATPITYFITGKLKRYEQIDVFDQHTNFNPLALSKPQKDWL